MEYYLVTISMPSTVLDVIYTKENDITLVSVKANNIEIGHILYELDHFFSVDLIESIKMHITNDIHE